MNNNDNNEREGRKSPYYRMALEVVAIGVILYVSLNHLNVIGNVLMGAFMLVRPLMIGGLIALILNTPMHALEKLITYIWRKCRWKTNRDVITIVALVLTVALAILLIYAIAGTVIPQTIASISALVAQSPKLIPKLVSLISKLEQYGIDTTFITDWLTSLDLNTVIANFGEDAISIFSTIVANITSIKNGASSIITGASNLISGTFTALTSLIFSIYVLANKRNLGCQCKKLAYAFFRQKYVDKAIELCSIVSKTFSNFISGQCLDACLLGVLVFFAMTIFGFPYALAVSSLITVTAVIPYVGAFIGGAFGVLLMIIDAPVKALLFVVLFICCQQVDDHFMYPRVVGGSVGLPAIWTFAAVIVGGSVWGIVGMVLFIPMFSVCFTILKTSVYRRLGDRQISVQTLNEERDRDPFPEITPTPEGEPIIDTDKLKENAKKTAENTADKVSGVIEKVVGFAESKKAKLNSGNNGKAGNSAGKNNGKNDVKSASKSGSANNGGVSKSGQKQDVENNTSVKKNLSSKEKKDKLDFPEDGE